MSDAFLQFVIWSLVFDFARCQAARVADIAVQVAVAPKGVMGAASPFGAT